ncbi:hypothetical protein K443DRAFT_14849 [Laccaria amethystina LaAM-08-1]|uniref:Uncharacterized protein n=1 Tax=Laccaria amethystina LaAM-08-1 TaxID=1095629 RepID=A0A0C9X2W2_9AGAR|nr:hypothetical protein K443DRAFT_14849 [Laccaria amethystina LaAM-08-1]
MGWRRSGGITRYALYWRRFVAAFDNLTNKENKEFLGKACHAFCAFDQGGKWLGHQCKEGVAEAASLQGPDPTSQSASDFFATYTQDPKVWSQREPILITSSTRYHLVDTDEITEGCTGVDDLPNDDREVLQRMMTAGVFGTEFLSCGQSRSGGGS